MQDYIISFWSEQTVIEGKFLEAANALEALECALIELNLPSGAYMVEVSPTSYTYAIKFEVSI